MFARNVPVPLPTKGLFIEAENAELSPAFAAKLLNFQTNGISLSMRHQAEELTVASETLQRVPFEFAGEQITVGITTSTLTAWNEDGTVIDTIPQFTTGRVAISYISSQMVIASGYDVPVLFNGSTFSQMSLTVSTGVAINDFDGVIAHHDRLYFWNTTGPLEFYYGEVGAVTGALTRFPLSRLGNITGSLSSMLTLTIDAGFNTNDVVCIVTTTGEMVLYGGLDPGDAQDWNLVARVKAAPPVSPRAFARVGSDMWMVSSSGLVSVSAAVRQGVLGLISEISRPISDQILKRIEAGGAEWQMHVASNGSQVIINRQPTVGNPEQWIYQVDSGAWNTADYPARLWHNMGSETRFTGTDGRDMRMLQSPTSTEIITAEWVSGWFRLPGKTSIKSLTPTIIASGALSVTVTVLSDHDTTASDIAEASQTVTIEPDNPGDSVSLNDVIGCDAVGSVFQIRIEVTAKWAEIVNLQVKAR